MRNAKKHHYKVIRGVKRVLNADLNTDIKEIPFFHDRKRVIASFLAAVLILIGISVRFDQADSTARGNFLVLADSLNQIPDNPPMNGVAEGTGTHFAVTDSDYLNISLDSTDEIDLNLESIPEMIIMKFKAGTSGANSTSVTLSGLLPLTTYYKYEGNYNNHEKIASDANGKYTFTQGLTQASMVYIQPRPSTKYIDGTTDTGGDCSTVGNWDLATKTCTLITDVDQSLDVFGNGTTLDGNGHVVSGSKTGFGIFIAPNYSGITVKNVTVKDFSYGIYLYYNSDNIVKNNTVSGNYIGIRLDETSGNTIELNKVASINTNIYLAYSINNSIKNNDIGKSSTIGVSLYLSSNNNIVSNNTISNNSYGVYVWGDSDNNVVDGNNILNNKTGVTVGLIGTSGNKVVNNIVKYNTSGVSIRLHDSTYGNSIYNNYFDRPPVFNGAAAYDNYWNIAKTPGTNIVGGPYIAGNYWSSSTSTGFSDTCIDSDGDGICDMPYVMDSNNTDNLPLAKPDTAPPVTAISLSGTSGANSWYVSDATVTLSATDNSGSSVAKTEYSFDNAGWTTYLVPFTYGTEGESTIYYRSIDNGGNIEQTKTQAIKIDKTASAISGAATTSPNAANWYKQDVVVRFNCSDAVSGAIEPTFDKTISSEGINQSATGKCTDNAGNSSELEIGGIDIDKTSPTISVLRSPDPNSKGWNNTSVSVTFAASDSLSGIEGTPANIVNFTQEGAGQSANSAFTDKAGNTASSSASNVNIDLTAPVITGAATSAANANNWYKNDVTVHFNANDTLSGLASVSQDVILANEGAGQEAVGTAEDFAGNQATHKVSGINIDKTAPVISGAPSTLPNSNGWYNSNVTIEFTSSDSLSGIDTFTPNASVSQEGNNQSVTGSAFDKAGNKATIEVSGINIDKTPPTITGAATRSPNNNGWYNGEVAVHYNATDNLSGVDFVSPDSIISTEGASQSATGSATDKAGNSAEYAVDGINIDKTMPVTSAILSGTSKGNCYGSDVFATLFGHDNLSGISNIFYNLDNNGWFSYANKISISSDGLHNLSYDSVDKADNAESEKSLSFTIDKNPPEASIKFDSRSADIKVYDNKTGEEADYTLIAKNQSDEEGKGWDLRRYTLASCASNLSLTLKYKKEGNETKVKLVSAQYGKSAKIDLGLSSLQAEYSKEKSGSFKELEQSIDAKGLFNVSAKYSSSKNNTEIKVKLEGKKEQKETKQGMVILELLVDNGDLRYRY